MGESVIPILLIVLIVGFAVAYIIRAKKSGQKCIGCPDSKSCSGNCASCSFGCGKPEEDETKEN